MVAILTAERLREVLDYDPETGRFAWRARPDRGWNTKNVSRAPGGKGKDGYLRISIDHRKYLAHRLAWLHVRGQLPSHLDHRDLDKTNNRLSNLRIVDALDSSANVSIRKKTRSGFRGVWFRKDRARWCARITRAGHTRHLGSYKAKEEAARAYAVAAKQLYGEHCPLYLENLL